MKYLGLVLCSWFACAALAAPVPLPSPAFFKPGWDKPVDPDKDCKFTQTKQKLTIEVPGKDHDLTPLYKQMNAPRLLRDVEGDFRVEVRVSSDWPLSVKSSTPREEAYVVGALVIIDDPPIRPIRLEYGARRDGKELRQYVGWRTVSGTSWIDEAYREKWPLAAGAKHAYLRIERRGTSVRVFVSADHKKWMELGPSSFHVPYPAKLKVGVAAVSTSQLPLKVHFDQFDLGPLPPKGKRPAGGG